MTTFNAGGDAVPATDDVFRAETKAAVELAVKDEVKDVALGEGHKWMHDYLEFEGDKLEVRLPSEQALSAFSISVSRYMPAEVQNDMVGLFIANHLSVESYIHVFARMMNPDDTTYTKTTVGELMGLLSKTAVQQRKAAAEAAKALEDAKAS